MRGDSEEAGQVRRFDSAIEREDLIEKDGSIPRAEIRETPSRLKTTLGAVVTNLTCTGLREARVAKDEPHTCRRA